MAAMKEREYRKLRNEIEAEYHKKIEALDLVWKMSCGETAANGAAGQVFGKGTLLKAVRQALEGLRGDFVLKDVVERIRVNNSSFAATLKRASLSSTLKRLAKSHEIEVVEPGKGKRASTYRKVVVSVK